MSRAAEFDARIVNDRLDKAINDTRNLIGGFIALA